MSNRIPVTTEGNAPEATKPILTRLKRMSGMVPNVYAIIGHSPASLAPMLEWNDAIAKGKLRKREVEQLNLHVSELNGCAYCVSAHTAVATRVGLSADEITAARSGAGSNERENAILALARRVVRTGGSRAGTDLARLREAGVSDEEIIDVLAVVALNAFRNAVNVVGAAEIDFPKAPRLPSD